MEIFITEITIYMGDMGLVTAMRLVDGDHSATARICFRLKYETPCDPLPPKPETPTPTREAEEQEARPPTTTHHGHGDGAPQALLQRPPGPASLPPHAALLHGFPAGDGGEIRSHLAEAAERAAGGGRPGDCRHHRAREGPPMEGAGAHPVGEFHVLVSDAGGGVRHDQQVQRGVPWREILWWK